jgi:hypothetical protein
MVVGYTSVLRLGLIAAGPDADADAYDHFHIGMQLVGNPFNVTVHWVWLPLWHFVDAGVYALGGDIAQVRLFAVLCTALSTFVLTALLQHHLRASPSPIPWLAEAERIVPFAAGATFALWPLNLRGGASAEPEAFFQLLLLVATFAWQAERFALVGVALSLAVMLRYEAWVVTAAFGGAWLVQRKSIRAALAWVLPLALVLVWCVVHRVATGEWLRFLSENRSYVEEAWRTFRLAERDLPQLRQPLLWYAVTLPVQTLREWSLWLLPGVVWWVRRGPSALTVSGLALLGTVTTVWVLRSNLGLERHFSGLVALYASMTAAGLVVGVAWAGARLDPRVVRLASATVLALALVGFVRWRVLSAERAYRRDLRAFADDQAAARVLRHEAARDATVFTTRVPLRVMAGLPFERYVGWQPADLRDYNLFVESVHHGEAWVAASPDELHALREGIEVRYQSPALRLLRRRAPAVIDPAWRTAPPCR